MRRGVAAAASNSTDWGKTACRFRVSGVGVGNQRKVTQNGAVLKFSHIPISETGLLKKIHFAHLKHGFFHQNIGHLHLQGNVQVYNVRIPEKGVPFPSDPENTESFLIFLLVCRHVCSAQAIGTRSEPALICFFTVLCISLSLFRFLALFPSPWLPATTSVCLRKVWQV